MTDESGFMRRALELAERGRFRVEPNPLVGAVVVKDSEVVGEGWHGRYGGPHAEVVALLRAGDKARGSTVYVTLEPCGHLGKTSPCAHALAAMSVSRVVYAAADPNPLTAGKGPGILSGAGAKVESGLLGEEAEAQNPRFRAHLDGDLPFTIAKWAMTLDGKIADVEGGSKYITGRESRRLVHQMRGSVDAVAVGVGTLLADDPDLTAREGSPVLKAVRVVLDTHLRTPPDAEVVSTAEDQPTWLVCGEEAEGGEDLESAGCRVLRVPLSDGRLDLRETFRTLRADGLQRILLEGGGAVHASAFTAGIVHHVMAFTAPKLLGGAAAPTPVDGPGFRMIGEALELQDVRVEQPGSDVLVEGYTR